MCPPTHIRSESQEMSRKKAAVVAISSLCSLKKVSLRPNCSYLPLKSLVLLNNLNTWAAEERLDFHSDGNSNPDNPSNSEQYFGDFRVSGGGTTGSCQNPYVQNGYYKESSQQVSSGGHGVEIPHKTDRQMQDYGDGYYGGIGYSSSGGNGYYKESSQQIPSGTHGAGYSNTVDGQRQDFGGHYNGGVGLNSNENFSYGAGNSSWQSGILPQNSYHSFQGSGFHDQQNVGMPSTHTSYSVPAQTNYSANAIGMGSSIPQQTYGDYQSDNYVQSATTPFQGPGNVMPEGQSSDDMSPLGALEDLDKYCQGMKIKEAVEVLLLLEKQGIAVDLPRYLDLMKICRDEEALEEAKTIHEHLVKSLSPLRVSTYNKILQMYARCGSMDDANTVFSKMLEHNLTSWDSMISGYALNGLGEEAIDTFTRFKEAGLKPDSQMFIAVLNACAVTGDVIEGMLHYESMNKVHGISPNMKHYTSVVKMLGSCGYLDEALEFIERLPVEPSVDVWETLMDLSRVQGNSELGDRCAEIVEQMDPSCMTKEMKGGLVAVKASDLSREKDKKKASQNSLALRSKIHEYRAGDKSHPENDKIYALLRGMKQQMKEAGYVPDCRFVLHDIDQEGKEEALMAHSERLATAYGLITSSARSPIRIIKNLRVCVDCHNALKIVSELVGRELIMRDAKRFHHMKDGKCSCNDYW